MLTNPLIFVGRLSNKFKYINKSKIPKQNPRTNLLIEANIKLNEVIDNPVHKRLTKTEINIACFLLIKVVI